MKSLPVPALILFLSTLITPTLYANQHEPARFSGIVRLHNVVRAKHQLQALIWSDSLANYAKEWVNYLASAQNCEMMHRPNNGGGKYQQKHGENLFWASAIETASGKQLQNISVKEVVKAWAEEEQYYNYQTNQCQPGEDCGHYTQMVWHESQQVGCAMAVCSDKSQIWACNYYPRGNYIGEWPY